MTGPAGFGPNGFLTSGNALAYRIDFENMTNASAPAQQVIITDQLSTNYDWATFNVSEFGFGDQIIALPSGVQHLATNLTMSYLGTSFQVQIQIGIDAKSGLIRAQFQCIDPTTSLPPSVNIGFLPPEDGTGRGQGHVTYNVRARSGVTTGVQLRNVALISFDNQTTISTDQIDPLNAAAGVDPTKQCLITIDSVAPTSHVLPLPAQSQALQVPVSWTGQDDATGSGVGSYDVYYNDNGGAWTVWLSGATGTNASFRGQPQHTYGFSSAAHDNAGNVEAIHLTADTATKIVANPQFQLTITPATTNLNLNDSMSYAITVKNVGSLSLNNVTLSNAMSAGISLDWVMYGRGAVTIADGSLLWSLGTMTTNASATLTVSATAIANGTWTNLFAVTDSDGAAFANGSELIQINSTGTVLSITPIGTNVILSWPQAAGVYHLESTNNLVISTNWTPLTNVPVATNGQNSVLLPAASERKFFRLRSQ